ncbi:MAG: chromosome segregation protein SMC [Coprococcus sp.]|nr:chromosome segregation protein SMC [Coprococcus sp.]
MYLKSIEVNGFKSFANKIVFKFNHGITCIVGPNGSGKSNVADAVRWVLGEQSAKSLRGSKMEDVIFSGTELRKPQGSAYVAITLDNSDHSLPIDYNEVTVARRVYRSGESEYLINGTVSRLKDVTSLFFDTGIGKEGYSIIGQGQIEKILNGKPEERRELFDEAAGIVKFKKNKAAAEKSLEAERDNLSRVNDILKELEKQVGPLKEQSETARKYLAFKSELRNLDANAFLLEVEKLKEALEEDRKRLEIVNGDIEDNRRAYEQTKEEYEQIERTLEELNSEIDLSKNQIHEAKLNRERLEGEINVLNQQIITHRMTDQSTQEQIDRINSQIEANERELKGYTSEKQGLGDSVTDIEALLDKARKESEDLEKYIEDCQREIEDCKSDIIEYVHESGTLQAKVGRYDAMLENINFRKTQLNQRLLQFKSDDATDRKEYDSLLTQLKELEEAVKLILDDLDTNTASLNDNQERNKANRELIHNTNERLSATRSKLEALRNITERYDGYGNSIRRVMEQKQWNPGILGVVADIITVKQQYEIAVETALGGSIQNIVTEDDATAKRMISYLKTNKLGRATFLPLNTITVRGQINKEVLSLEGVIGVASDLVDNDPRYDTLVKNLLGRIIVVDNIDNALKVARKYNQSLRLVTVEGELINPGGSMTGGAFKNSSNLLGRKRELDELKEEITNLNATAQAAAKLDEELKESREHLKAEIERGNRELQEAYLKKNTLSISAEQIKEKLDETERVFASIEKEISELNNQINEININKSQLADNNKKHEQLKLQAEERITELESHSQEDKDKLAECNRRVSELLISYNSIMQKDEFIESNINRINEEIERCKNELMEYTSKGSSSAMLINELEEKIKAIKKSIEDTTQSIADVEERLSSYIQNREELTKNHKEFFDKREELSEKITGLEKDSYKLETAISKNSEKSDELCSYMWEEYEITYNTARDMKDDNLSDLTSLKKEIAAVKAKIKSLGDVNVNAIEDYKEVSERYEFLKTQHDDIVLAETNLVNIIGELEKSMQEQFTQKFKEIQTMFDRVFKELFGGGRGALELVDSDDLLETGIRIIAQPPGKKLQNMMQLSGGEKSLTAIALLFAIQSLKPSPFCLLDEIEAALDDSNVRRFARYLDRLTKDTQFIVISHRKGTMEAADILYGITMQEKGVSTLVSVNLIENDLDK